MLTIFFPLKSHLAGRPFCCPSAKGLNPTLNLHEHLPLPPPGALNPPFLAEKDTTFHGGKKKFFFAHKKLIFFPFFRCVCECHVCVCARACLWGRKGRRSAWESGFPLASAFREEETREMALVMLWSIFKARESFPERLSPHCVGIWGPPVEALSPLTS